MTELEEQDMADKEQFDLEELKEVKELLIPSSTEEPVAEDEALEELRRERRSRMKPLWITLGVVIVLSAIGLGIIYSNPELRVQWEALLAGELGAYKEQIRKKKEDLVRQIELLTSNDYGTLTLVYTPKDARVHIKQYMWTVDCSSTTTPEELLQCLKKPHEFDFSKAKVKEIDNPSLHLDAKKKQILNSLPLNNLPLKESSDDGKKVYYYEYLVKIEREGYKPKTFFFTTDASRKPPVKDARKIVWVLRGPGLYMADFQGADLEPLPETAKENYVKATIDLYCLDKEIEKGRKEGKKYSEDNITQIKVQILNKYGFKTVEQYNQVAEELSKDKEFVKELQKTLKETDCSKQ